ncbi:MAG: DUF2934 domain-containing protein [Acidobacteriia bacterium]|nr:DUF2934 domain-containing protein [Terriglobia bacterium]
MQPVKKSAFRFVAPAMKTVGPSSAKVGESKKATGAQGATPRTLITENERHGLIAHAAYLAAAHRGFQGGSPERDWLDAEAQIDAKLMKLR